MLICIGIIVVKCFDCHFFQKEFFNITIFDCINLIFVGLNIFLLIELYNIFVKRLNEKQRQEDFKSKKLEILLDLISELKDLNTIDDKKYITKLNMLQKKTSNYLALLTNVMKETEKEKVKICEIKENFDKHRLNCSEKTYDLEKYNLRSDDYKNELDRLEKDISELEAIVLKFD